MSTKSRSTCCFPEDLLVAKRTQISLFHSSELRTSLTNAVQAVSVFHCEAVKPADEGKTQGTLNKRLIKTSEDDETDRKRI